MSTGFSDIMQGLASAVMLGTSSLMIIKPGRWQTERSGRRERQLADRLERGHDRYFEELRTLQSYSEPLNPRTVRVFGIGLFILSAAILSSILFK